MSGVEIPMTQFPHESFREISTIQAQQLMTTLLEKPHDGSPDDLAELTAVFTTVEAQWREEWDAFNPETTGVITQFVRSFWNDTDVRRTELCLDVILVYDLYSLIGLVATGMTSGQPMIRWRCRQAMNQLSSYDTFAFSIFVRFNVIRRLIPDDLIPAEAQVAEEVVRGLRNSLPLSLEKRQGVVPREELLEALKTVLGRRWMTVVRRTWLLNLIDDYRSVYSRDSGDVGGPLDSG